MSKELSVSDVKKKLKGYNYSDQAARDIQALLKNFRGLKLQDLKTFVHPNGSRESMISVSGTIPVSIRGHTYNIPISVWPRLNHPYVCPLVYVTPTREMGIQQSQFVDASGMVYLPYLSEWNMAQSDMTILIQVLCATFADHCPVYSKTAQQPQPQPQMSWQHHPQRPVQPPSTYSTPTAYRSPYPQQQPPRLQYPTGQPYSQQTPYPSGHTAMPTPTSYAGGYQSPPASGAQPPYPTQYQQYPGMYPPSTQPTHPPHPPHPPTSSVHSSVVAATALGAAAATISAEEEERHFKESERIKRQSLETAVADKIRRQVKQVLDSAQDEMDSMLETQEKLKKGSQQLNQMLEDMEKKQRDVDQNIDMLNSKNAELESVLDYLRAQPETIDVDEAVTATNPLYNQILRLYAQENAVDDTIYFLGEALRKGVIELEVFLKHVRELSRQQFIARATIMKARIAAGLPSHGIPT